MTNLGHFDRCKRLFCYMFLNCRPGAALGLVCLCLYIQSIHIMKLCASASPREILYNSRKMNFSRLASDRNRTLREVNGLQAWEYRIQTSKTINSHSNSKILGIDTCFIRIKAISLQNI